MEKQSHSRSKKFKGQLKVYFQGEPDCVAPDLNVNNVVEIEKADAVYLSSKSNFELVNKIPGHQFHLKGLADKNTQLKVIDRISQLHQKSTELTLKKKKILSLLDKSRSILDQFNARRNNGPNKNVTNVRPKIKIDQMIEKVSMISELPSAILNSCNFQQYHICQIFVHEKGKTYADNFSSSFGASNSSKIKVSSFNLLHKHFKKSKSGRFDQSISKNLNIMANGHYLAEAYDFKHHRIILILSHNSFLAPDSNDVSLFKQFANIIAPLINTYFIKEQSNKKSIILHNALKHFPIPLKILDTENKILLTSNLNLDVKEEIFKDALKIQISEKNCLYLAKATSSEFAGDVLHHNRILLLGELLNTLQHELSNPLFGLNLAIELFETDKLSKDAIDFTKNIQSAVTRCQNIIKNFSNLYKNDTQLKSCDLKQIIEDTFTLSKSETKRFEKSIQFSGFNEDDFTFKTNPTWLSQILFNLLINSAQALNSSKNYTGRIQIRVHRDTATKAITINYSDNGPGIPYENVNYLFRPFFTTKPQGTGLGLAICKNLTQRLNGDIQYQVQPQGATFILKFPILN